MTKTTGGALVVILFSLRTKLTANDVTAMAGSGRATTHSEKKIGCQDVRSHLTAWYSEVINYVVDATNCFM